MRRRLMRSAVNRRLPLASAPCLSWHLLVPFCSPKDAERSSNTASQKWPSSELLAIVHPLNLIPCLSHDRSLQRASASSPFPFCPPRRPSLVSHTQATAP